MKKTKQELIEEIVQWGAKLQRTGNRLSEREHFAFADTIKEAKATNIKDKEIDQALKEGRDGLKPKPRYDQTDGGIFDRAEVTRWI